MGLPTTAATRSATLPGVPSPPTMMRSMTPPVTRQVRVVGVSTTSIPFDERRIIADTPPPSSTRHTMGHAPYVLVSASALVDTC